MNIQKILVNTIASIAMALAAISTANADTANGSASASVVTAVTVAETRGLDFGTFVPDPAGDTISLTSTATTTRSSLSILTTLVGTTEASGAFQITGTTGATVSISIADTGDLGTMTFTPGAPSLGATHVIDAIPANNLLYVGGNLVVPAGQATGVFSNATAYSVTVNYQ